ncbi:unnamed protein product [Phytomonas sp. Hart1]|nr:unnamed protein product [Phytomonas sp. Hart1]|eukprot:CCW69013.1 unnamed protein product [Phytomonas sp. isolate Hart1]
MPYAVVLVCISRVISFSLIANRYSFPGFALKLSPCFLIPRTLSAFLRVP